MRKVLIVILMLLSVTAVVAQDNKQQETAKPAVTRNDFSWARNPYRLDFVVKELEDNKVMNTRSYSMIMQSSEDRGRSFGEVKTGSRVPIVTTTKEGASTTQYMDVGISINAQLYALDNSILLLSCSTEVSSLADAQTGSNPIVRQMRTNTTGEV